MTVSLGVGCMAKWLPVVSRGAEAGIYEVSSDGAVRRVGKRQALRPQRHQDHLYILVLDEAGRRHFCRLARLVLDAFDGDPGSSYSPQHLNGNHDDCRLVNLRWRPRGDLLRAAYERRVQRLRERS